MAAKRTIVAKPTNLRIKSLSPSAIDVYLQCSLKYWFRYFTKEKDLGDTVPLRFGSAVHAALQDLGNELLAGQPFTAELCDKAAVNFIKHAAKYRIADPALIAEGQDLVKARFTRHNPTYKIVATEFSFSTLGITTSKGTPLNGIIDLVQELSPSTVLILDYKTSKRAKTLQEAKTDIQLSMYDLIYSKFKPEYDKLWLALDFLRSEPVVTDRSVEERLAFEAWVDALWESLGDLSEKDVTPSINSYCPWCGYKHLCHEYTHILEGCSEYKPAAMLTTTDEFIKEWEATKLVERIAKDRLVELKGWANNKVDFEGISRFESDNTIISWTQSNYSSYDIDMILPYIPLEDLSRMITFKKEPLEFYVATERPDLRPLVDQATRMTPGAPRMTSRKK